MYRPGNMPEWYFQWKVLLGDDVPLAGDIEASAAWTAIVRFCRGLGAGYFPKTTPDVNEARREGYFWEGAILPNREITSHEVAGIVALNLWAAARDVLIYECSPEAVTAIDEWVNEWKQMPGYDPCSVEKPEDLYDRLKYAALFQATGLCREIPLMPSALVSPRHVGRAISNTPAERWLARGRNRRNIVWRWEEIAVRNGQQRAYSAEQLEHIRRIADSISHQRGVRFPSSAGFGVSSDWLPSRRKSADGANESGESSDHGENTNGAEDISGIGNISTELQEQLLANSPWPRPRDTKMRTKIRRYTYSVQHWIIRWPEIMTANSLTYNIALGQYLPWMMAFDPNELALIKQGSREWSASLGEEIRDSILLDAQFNPVNNFSLTVVNARIKTKPPVQPAASKSASDVGADTAVAAEASNTYDIMDNDFVIVGGGKDIEKALETQRNSDDDNNNPDDWDILLMDN